MNAATRDAMGAVAAAHLAAAGAPELPEHHLYRISPDKHSDHVVRVEIRKLTKDVGTSRLSWSTFSLRDGEINVTALVRACHEAYADAFPEGVSA